MKHFFIIPLLLICAACIQLGGKPQAINYYLLEATAGQTTDPPSQEISLVIESVELATYLDRPQIVSRVQLNTLYIADDHRWGDPLVDNLTRVLRENLYRQVPNISISSGPWATGNGPSYRLKLMVNRFNGAFDKQAEVDIRWTLSRAGETNLPVQKHFASNQPTDDNYLALVSSLSEALYHFSRDVAGELSPSAIQ